MRLGFEHLCTMLATRAAKRVLEPQTFFRGGVEGHAGVINDPTETHTKVYWVQKSWGDDLGGRETARTELPYLRREKPVSSPVRDLVCGDVEGHIATINETRKGILLGVPS